MNTVDVLKAKDKDKPLLSLCNSVGDSKELEIALDKYGDFISAAIMAKFIEQCRNADFYELSPEAKMFECANMFDRFMVDFYRELE